MKDSAVEAFHFLTKEKIQQFSPGCIYSLFLLVVTLIQEGYTVFCTTGLRKSNTTPILNNSPVRSPGVKSAVP